MGFAQNHDSPQPILFHSYSSGWKEGPYYHKLMVTFHSYTTWWHYYSSAVLPTGSCECNPLHFLQEVREIDRPLMTRIILHAVPISQPPQPSWWGLLLLNVSYALDDFAETPRPTFRGDVVLWLFMHTSQIIDLVLCTQMMSSCKSQSWEAWLTNLCDEDSELVKVAESLGTCPQLPNHLVELLCSWNRVLQVWYTRGPSPQTYFP